MALDPLAVSSITTAAGELVTVGWDTDGLYCAWAEDGLTRICALAAATPVALEPLPDGGLVATYWMADGTTVAYVTRDRGATWATWTA